MPILYTLPFACLHPLYLKENNELMRWTRKFETFDRKFQHFFPLSFVRSFVFAAKLMFNSNVTNFQREFFLTSTRNEKKKKYHWWGKRKRDDDDGSMALLFDHVINSNPKPGWRSKTIKSYIYVFLHEIHSYCGMLRLLCLSCNRGWFFFFVSLTTTEAYLFFNPKWKCSAFTSFGSPMFITLNALLFWFPNMY